MFAECLIQCCICGKPMDWMQRYGMDQGCCSKVCYDEFDWRRTLAILGKQYYKRETHEQNATR